MGGIVWLPRLAAKVRANDAGLLGNYLLGQSPVDDSFLAAAGLDYAALIAIVRAAGDDEGVLAAIEVRAPGATVRLRAWSDRVQAGAAWFMRILDFDDGYARPSALDGVHAAGNRLFAAVARLLRRMRPLRA